jgi:hypothetical protein
MELEGPKMPFILFLSNAEVGMEWFQQASRIADARKSGF